MSAARREIWTGPEEKRVLTDPVALGLWVMAVTIDGTQSVLVPWDAIDALRLDMETRKAEAVELSERVRALTARNEPQP